MSADRDLSVAERMALPRPAEDQWLAYAARHDIPTARFGLDRAPFRATDSAFVNHCPDFATEHYLVECQGLGREQQIRVKRGKLDSLLAWEFWLPVRVFLYDSFRDRVLLLPLVLLREALVMHGQQGAYKVDGVRYFSIAADHFKGWTNVPR